MPRRRRRRRRAPPAAATATSRWARAATTATWTTGDGCSKTCKLEGGFTCDAMAQPDTEAARAGNSGECLKLPVIYRDFKNESVSGGHPDFFYLGAPSPAARQITGVQGQAGAITSTSATACPNSSGPAKKNDSTARCWDLAQATLGANGKPVFNTARTGGTNCDCQFTDWSHDGQRGPRPRLRRRRRGSPTYRAADLRRTAPAAHPCTAVRRPIVKARPASASGSPTARSRADRTSVEHARDGRRSGGGQYQFSSRLHAVYGGFFPLDPTGPVPARHGGAGGPGHGADGRHGEPMLCNLWPYWYCTASFGAGGVPRRPVPVPAQPRRRHDGESATACGSPACRAGSTTSGSPTRRATCSPSHGAFSLQFFGDDDLFIFINGKLIIDLGGVHQRLPGLVSIVAPTARRRSRRAAR